MAETPEINDATVESTSPGTADPLQKYPLVKLADDSGDEAVLIDTTKFTSEHMHWAKEQANNLDLMDTNSVLLFASEPQKDLNSFLDTLLNEIKAKDAGPVGDLTIALAKGIEVTRLNEFQRQMTKGRSLLAKLPLIGSFWDYARVFMARQEDFQKLIDRIEREATDRNERLMRKNVQLDELYEENERAQNAMALWIVAGEYAIDLGNERLRELQAESEQSKDPQKAKQVHDFSEQFTTFKTRVIDMKVAYMRAMVSGPQIRTVQQAAKIEMQNIQRSIMNDLTALKQAVVMAAANYGILQAQAERKGRTEAVRKIEQANIEATGQAYISAKESQGLVLDDALHVADIANKLLDTLKQGVEIDKQNEQKRAEAERVLIETKDNLKKGLEQVKALQQGE